MEFPDLGENCSVPSCRQLDFLPFKCDACSKMFCLAHRMYADHSCPCARTKVVPTCPLCQSPVPLLPGETADSAVTKHIDNNCDSDVARRKREKLKANRCALRGCKNKDALRVDCSGCRLRYCLNHRHEMDHSCQGPRADRRPPSSPLVVSRGCSGESNSQSNSPSKRPTASYVHSLQQPGLSEEEALRRAIELSLRQSSDQGMPSRLQDEAARRLQDETDEALARALQEAEYSKQRTPVTTASDPSKQNCCVS